MRCQKIAGDVRFTLEVIFFSLKYLLGLGGSKKSKKQVIFGPKIEKFKIQIFYSAFRQMLITFWIGTSAHNTYLIFWAHNDPLRSCHGVKFDFFDFYGNLKICLCHSLFLSKMIEKLF